ncbi:hypothetical protein BGZ93_006784 [Podila epicladia]|nr:hypothetical protein BGZ92_001184 [Podila epicladia]KAG0094774.1 hypothetical protein BGZ93_006784 [Podila epicladia]
MAIQLKGPACIAVNQDSIYAVIEGSQPNSRDGSLFTLIKTEHPTIAAGNNTWTVVSTMPTRSIWTEEYDIFEQMTFVACSVDRDGTFTMRSPDSSGLRYDPRAPKAPQLQTCSADSNSHGEWQLTSVVRSSELGTFRPLIIRPEIVSSGSNNSGGYNDGDEIVIYPEPVYLQGPPFIQYARIRKEMAITNVTIDDLSPRISLSEKNATVEMMEYADGQIFSILAFEPKIPIPGTNKTTYNRTLTYFPFEAPFQLTSPPTSAVSIPWNLDCGPMDAAVSMVSKARFYYLCSALDVVTNIRTFKLYIYDSKTKQMQSLTSQSDTIPIMFHSARLLPVYSASQQHEPQFLVVNRLPQYTTADRTIPYYVPTYIDLQASNSSVQSWPRIALPDIIPVGERLYPSCRTRQANKKLVVAAIISSLFGIAVAAFLVFRWRRKRKSKASGADDDSLQETLDGEHNVEKLSSTDP